MDNMSCRPVRNLDLLMVKGQGFGKDVRGFIEDLMNEKIRDLCPGDLAEGEYDQVVYKTGFGTIVLKKQGDTYVLSGLSIFEKGYFSIFGYQIGDQLSQDDIAALGLESGWFKLRTITALKHIPELKGELAISYQKDHCGKAILTAFSFEKIA